MKRHVLPAAALLAMCGVFAVSIVPAVGAPPTPLACAVRGTIDEDETLTSGSGDLSSCPATGASRVEVRILGATDKSDCFCISPDGGSNWITVDGEQPVWASTFVPIRDAIKLANGGSSCAVCDEGSGRSFEVVIND